MTTFSNLSIINFVNAEININAFRMQEYTSSCEQKSNQFDIDCVVSKTEKI